jgi:hypothetical protein
VVPQSTTDLVRRIASAGLPGSSATLPAAPLDDTRWGDLLDAVAGARLTGQLARVVRSGELAATPAQIGQLRTAHRKAMLICLMLEQSLKSLLDVLEPLGVDHRLLKGASVARTTYADPSLRPYIDNDVLIPGTRIEEVIAELTAVGYVRNHASPRPGFDRRFGKGASMVGPDGFEVDLHRTLLAGPFGLALDPDELFRQPPDTIEYAGRAVPVLPRHLRLLHACYHAAVTDNPPKLVPLRDIAEMLHGHPDDLDRVRAQARAWRGEAVIARAIWITADHLGLDGSLPGLAWARAYQPTAFERRSLRIYHGYPTYAEKAFAGFFAIPSARDRLAYGFAFIWPERDYVSARDGTRLSRFRRAVDVGVRTTSRPSSGDIGDAPDAPG